MAENTYDTAKVKPQLNFKSSRGSSAIGIAYPIGNSSDGTFFKQTFTTLDAAKANMKNLILTMPSERIMHPSMGTNIWNLMFEPMNTGEEVSYVINTMVREAVERWLPYILLEKVNASFDDTENKLNIEIQFSLRADPSAKDMVNITISKGDL